MEITESAQREVMLRLACWRLIAAIEDEGPRPRVHRQIQKRHRKEWPTLWATIDQIMEVIER